MNWIFRTTVAVFLAAAIFVGTPFQSAWAEPEKPAKPQENTKTTKQIVLVIIDGLQAEALQKAATPNINGLGAAGVKVEKVNSVYPDSTEATVASILTGTLPQQHGFTGPQDKLTVPTIQTLMEDKKIHTSFFDGTGKLKQLLDTRGYTCKGPFNGKDSLVMDNYLREATASKAYFNIIVLPELRGILQKNGANSDAYLQAVSQADNQVGRLLRYLHQEGTYEQSMIVITGTCGTPPIVMKGLPFGTGLTLPPAGIADITPTLLHVNGINGAKTSGLVLWNALLAGSEQTESYLFQQRVNDLSNAYFQSVQDMLRLQGEKNQVKEEKARVSREKENIQAEIDKRDRKISGLTSRINLIKLAGAVVVGLFCLGYLVEYRLLKKRFLMF